MADATPAELLISGWTLTELSSAMVLKLRTGQITLEQRAAALAMFNSLMAETFTTASVSVSVSVSVSASHFRTAAKFVDQHALGLRAGDALHLATASDHGAVVCTLDRRLAAAGPPLGVPTHLLT